MRNSVTSCTDNRQYTNPLFNFINQYRQSSQVIYSRTSKISCGNYNITEKPIIIIVVEVRPITYFKGLVNSSLVNSNSSNQSDSLCINKCIAVENKCSITSSYKTFKSHIWLNNNKKSQTIFYKRITIL